MNAHRGPLALLMVLAWWVTTAIAVMVGWQHRSVFLLLTGGLMFVVGAWNTAATIKRQ
jgi:hypothetical protein